MRSSGFAIGLVLLGHLASCPASADCINYSDYLHWVNAIDMPGAGNTINYAGMAVSGTYAYVAYGVWGLQVIDIADSRTPRIVGSLPTIREARDVAVSGAYAYVTTFVGTYEPGLLVVDVSHPENPEAVGSVSMGDSYSVAISGNHAYVAAGSSSFQVVDISDPHNPQIVGSADTGYSYGVAVSGNYAYVASDHYFCVVDIRDPRGPRVVAGLERPGPVWNVEVSGTHVYLEEEAPDGPTGEIQVVDVSDPQNPRVEGELGTAGFPMGITIAGAYAYIALAGSDGLLVIDIANPASPEIVGRGYGGYGMDVRVVGHYAYVVDANWRFHVIDITNPESPPIVGGVQTDFWALDVAVSGDYAYVSEVSFGGGGALQVIDVADPQNPRVLGTVSTPGWALGVAVSNGYAYVADGYLGAEGSGLQVIDIADPGNPRIVGYLRMDATYRVVISGTYAYVADYYHGLQVVDITDPTNPRIVGNASTMGWAEDVAVAGDCACVAQDFTDMGLETIDVSDPTNPHFAGTLSAEDNLDLGGSNAVAVSGAHAYFSGGHFGLRVADIGDCQLPSIVGRVHVNGASTGFPGGLAASGNYAYLANAGLQVIDVRNPLNPELAGDAWIGLAAGVALSDRYAYVATMDRGLRIVPVQCESGAGISADAEGVPMPRIRAFPNPASQGSVIRLELPVGVSVHVAIHDVGGRLVRSFRDEVLSAGVHDLSWDGCDDSGRPVAAGIYWVRVKTSKESRTAHIVVLR